ncbi:MAG TPA: GAF domain-containing protein [Thermomicrobiaceae bacterium]|nr:GAF domain-containing protein [Thermomicrobiaceae bacterium]
MHMDRDTAPQTGTARSKSAPSVANGATQLENQAFRALLESAPDAIVIVDERASIVLVNSRTEQLFGYPREELIGQPLEILLPERFRGIHRAHRNGYLAAPRTRPMGTGLELFGRRRDGSEFPTEISLSPLRTEHGLLVTGIVRDVTDRKRAEAERAQLLARERAARADAEAAADALRRTQAVTDVTLAHLGLEDLLRELIGRIRDVLTVDTVVVLLLDPETNTLEPRAAVGLDGEVGAGIRVPVGRGFAGQVAARRQSVIIDEVDEADIYNPVLRSRGLRSLLGVPLLVEGRVLGVLHVGTLRSRRFTAEDARLLQLVGDRIALAIDRAHLYDAERAALGAAEAAEERAAFLAAASALLSDSLDYETTLASLARLCVPRLADWCMIYVLGEDGAIYRLGNATHLDPERSQLAREISERHAPAANARWGVARVLRTGESEFYVEVPLQMLEDAAESPEHLARLRGMGITSAMIVPLVARDRTSGAITLVMAESGRRYNPLDLALAEDLAGRAALAVDNAGLYRQAQQANQQIQLQAARAQALSEAAQDFAAASLHVRAVLETVTRKVAEVLGDGCVIRLLSADEQQLEPVALYHPDPTALSVLHDIVAAPHLLGEGISGRVFATGQPVLVPTVRLQDLRRLTKPEYWPYLDRFGLHSVLVVPLRVRGRAIGALLAWRDRISQGYTADDQAFLQDLADRAALAVDNALLYQEAQQAVLAREEFLSIASHELKTPLTTVKGWVHLLDDQLHQPELDRASLVEFTDELRGQVDRFELLIGDLLDASRIQQGRLDLRPEPVDLVKLARRVVTRFNHAPERTPRHVLVLDGAPRLIGLWDPDRLDQVLTNLCSNALKYSPEGGEVRIAIGREDDDAVLSVSDTGIGMSAEDQATLFQPFARSEHARRSASGTGLGLFITRRIVEQHGGTIGVASELGAGTTFTVHLPLRPAEPPEEDGVQG